MGIGAYQDDAMQKITGTLYPRPVINNMGGGIGLADGKLFTLAQQSHHGQGQAIQFSTSVLNLDVLTLDTSQVVRTSSETRGKATRFALRLVIY